MGGEERVVQRERPEQPIIFSVRKEAEPDGTAHCYEVGSGDWREAISAFLLERSCRLPYMLR